MENKKIPVPAGNFGKKKVQPEKVNLEKETNKEISEAHAKLRAATLNEQKTTSDVLSTGYWFAVYFADTEQRNEFVRNAGLDKVMAGQYFNGEQFAEKVGVKITKKKISPPKAFRKHKNLTDFTIN